MVSTNLLFNCETMSFACFNYSSLIDHITPPIHEQQLSAFFNDLLKRPAYEVIWVFYMMAINLFAIYFWEELLAKAILIVLIASSMFLMSL